MDVNVKGLDPVIVARLAEQAEAEGVSAREWIRQALRRTAGLRTPTGLKARVSERVPVDGRYAEEMATVAARRAPASQPSRLAVTRVRLTAPAEGRVPDCGR